MKQKHCKWITERIKVQSLTGWEMLTDYRQKGRPENAKLAY